VVGGLTTGNMASRSFCSTNGCRLHSRDLRVVVTAKGLDYSSERTSLSWSILATASKISYVNPISETRDSGPSFAGYSAAAKIGVEIDTLRLETMFYPSGAEVESRRTRLCVESQSSSESVSSSESQSGSGASAHAKAIKSGRSVILPRLPPRPLYSKQVCCTVITGASVSSTF
jgi:hypothetical protein